jgi:hypothetical protein
MSGNDFERLRNAVQRELKLYKPSEQDYETTLTKAKMHSGLENIRLTQDQKNILYNIYSKSIQEEWKENKI